VVLDGVEDQASLGQEKAGLVSCGLGECKQAEIEGKDGLERQHPSLLPGRLWGEFLLLPFGTEQGVSPGALGG
jgi:hypothetical protein